jgi:hypothetical protein
MGWLLLSDPGEGARVRAKSYFEESSIEGDADGFAGLAWMEERFGASSADIEAAFSDYVRAQYRYEEVGDLEFAREVAERRATLAYSIPLERLGNLFLSARGSLSSSINRSDVK